MGFYEEAEARIHKELPSVKGQKEGAIKGAVEAAGVVGQLEDNTREALPVDAPEE